MPQPYSKRTVEVGDVGYLNDSGNFVFSFNLFLPGNDPLNQLFRKGLPEGYIPLDPPTNNEILKISDYFAPGSVIASNGVDVTRVSESPLHLKFRSSEPEAVALVLPDGASREDFKGLSRLQEYLKTHAESWIQYLSNGTLYSVPNGGLYVITGCDKAPTCSTAVFPYKHFLGSRHTSFEFAKGYMQPASRLGIDSYEGRDHGRDVQEHCLFVRGIRIALSDPEWNIQIDEGLSEDTPISPLPLTPPISDQVLPAKIDVEEPLQLETRINNTCSTDTIDSDISQENEVQVCKYPFHPSDLILQIMLSTHPDTKLALVDDYTWSQFAKISQKVGLHEPARAPLVSRCKQNSFISDWGILLDAIFKSHVVVETDGILNLIPKQSKNFSMTIWFDSLRKQLRSRQSSPEPVWATALVVDLVRQGESIRGPGQKFVIN
uniref:Uncharacterized protein n=1 Tax=Psilocybe cubensis TaxID=181762 RepID=A0A8H7XYF9_PSICU